MDRMETLLRKYYHADGGASVWWPGRKERTRTEFQKFLSGTKRLMNLAV